MYPKELILENVEIASAGSETDFKTLLNNHGLVCLKAPTEIDIMDKIDSFIIKGSKWIPIQIKGEKKTKREDDEFCTDRITVEWEAIGRKENQKHTGSLYGKAKYFAFSVNGKWIIVDRLELLKVCERLCPEDDIVYTNENYLYKRYKRKGNNDSISQVLVSDIIHLNIEICNL